MKARQYVTAETLTLPEFVPPAGVRPDQMIVKFSWWPRDMATQMFLRHTDVAEPPCEGPLCHVK